MDDKASSWRRNKRKHRASGGGGRAREGEWTAKGDPLAAHRLYRKIVENEIYRSNDQDGKKRKKRRMVSEMRATQRKVTFEMFCLRGELRMGMGPG